MHAGSPDLLLSFLVRPFHPDLSPEDAARLWQRVTSEAPGADLLSSLVRAAALRDVQVYEVGGGLGGVAPILERGGVALLVRADGSGWMGVEGRSGDLWRVTDDHDTGVLLPAAECRSRLGEDVRLFTAEVAHPVPHGGHGHHATPLQSLRRLLGGEARDVWIVAVYAAAAGLLSLAVPVAVQALVNQVAFGRLLQPIVVLTVLLLGVLLLSGALRALQVRVVEVLQERVFVKVAAQLAHRLPRARVESFDARHGPELVNRFFDVLTVQKSAATLLLDGLALALQTALGFLLIGFYHPLLLAFAVVLASAVAFIVLVLGREGTSTAIDESLSKYAVAAWLEELARTPGTFKTAGAPTFALERTDQLAREYLVRRRRHFRIVFRQTVASFGLHAVGSALLLGLGGLLVMQGRLTIGALVAAELIVGTVLYGLTKLGKQLETWYDLLAAADKLAHLLDVEAESDPGEQEPSGRGPARLVLDDVSFTYEGGRPLLDGASFDLRPGRHACLVAGRGRSTVAELAMGLRRPSHGSIELDGVDLRSARLEGWRSRVAVVRAGEVFSGTLEENIRLGRPHVTADDVARALALTGLDADLRRLPEGLATQVTTGGAPLSRGEALRLVLARAVAARPGLLVIDDDLEGIEEEVHARMLARLFAADAPWTALWTSPGPSWRTQPVAPFVIRDGRIVAGDAR